MSAAEHIKTEVFKEEECHWNSLFTVFCFAPKKKKKYNMGFDKAPPFFVLFVQNAK